MSTYRADLATSKKIIMWHLLSVEAVSHSYLIICGDFITQK